MCVGVKASRSSSSTSFANCMLIQAYKWAIRTKATEVTKIRRHFQVPHKKTAFIQAVPSMWPLVSQTFDTNKSLCTLTKSIYTNFSCLCMASDTPSLTSLALTRAALAALAVWVHHPQPRHFQSIYHLVQARLRIRRNSNW